MRETGRRRLAIAGVSTEGCVLQTVLGALREGYENGLLPGARPDPHAPWLDEPLDLESRLVLDTTGAVIAEAGGDLRSDLLRVWQWITVSYPDDDSYAASRSHWPALPSGTPYSRNFASMVGDRLRSSTGVGVRQLPVPDAMLALDLIAVDPGTGDRKQGVTLPPDIPAPKTGYSPVVRYGDWVFLSGVGATDFNGDWMADRLVIKGLRIEVALVLLADDAATSRRTIEVEGVARPYGHVPQAVHAGELLFTGSLLPVGSDGAVPDRAQPDPRAPFFREPSARRADLLVEQTAGLCEAAGTTLGEVCKVQAFSPAWRACPGC